MRLGSAYVGVATLKRGLRRCGRVAGQAETIADSSTGQVLQLDGAVPATIRKAPAASEEGSQGGQYLRLHLSSLLVNDLAGARRQLVFRR